MAKSKKSKILASMLAVSTMAVFYAAPVMAEKLYVYDDRTVVTENATEQYKDKQLTKIDGLEEIKFGNTDNNSEGFIKIISEKGEGIIRVGDAHGVNTRVYDDGFYVNTSGDDRNGLTETSLKAGALTLAGNKLTSVQLANINNVIGENGVINAANGSTVGGVTMNAGRVSGTGFFVRGSDNALGTTGLKLGNEYLNETKLGTINDVITEEGAVESKGDVTSKAADGKIYTLNNVGKNTSGIISGYGGQVTTIEGAFSVNENGYIYNADGSFQVTGDGAARFGKENDNHVHMEDGVLSIKTDQNTTVASLSEDGLKLGNESLTDTSLGVINKVIQEDGSVVSQGDVTSTTQWGKKYSLNKIGHNTQAIGYSGAGHLTTVYSDFAVGEYFNVDRETGAIRALKDDRFWLDGEGNLTVNNGTAKIGTGANKVELFAANNTVVTNENGTTFTNENGASTLIDGDVLETGTAKVDRLEAGDTVVDDRGMFVKENGNIASSLTSNNLTVGGESVVTVVDGNVTAKVDRLEAGDTVVDDRGLFVKTDDQSIAAQITEDGLKLGNESLTATKLGTINDVITDKGEVKSQGDVTSYDAKNDKTNSLNKVASNLNKLEGSVGDIGDNVKHVKHYDEFAIGDNAYDATVIEDSVAITNERGIDVIGDNGTSMAVITKDGVARFGDNEGPNVRLDNGDLEIRSNEWTTTAVIRNNGTARFGADADKNIRMVDGVLSINSEGTNAVASLSEEGLMLSDEQSRSQTLNATDIADIKGIDRDIVEETFGDVTTTTKTTTIEGALKVSDNGFISNANESFTVDANGTLTAAGGRFTVSDVTGAHFYGSDSMFSDYTNINGGRIEINGADGSQTVINGGKVTSTGDFITLDEEGKQKYTLNTIGVDLDTLEGNVGTIGKNVGGISREGYENAAYGEGRTEIEDLLAVNGVEGKVSVMGKDGTVAVITKDGTARFGVETGKNLRWKNGELAINSSGEEAVAKLSEKGLMLTDNNGAQTLTATKIADIKGITRDPVAETTTIENFLNVSGNSVSAALGGNSFTFDNSGFKFTGEVNLGSASDIYFNYGGVGSGTNHAGSYTLEDLADTVADIYDRTQGISYDSESGTTTIDGNLNVSGDAETGEGGNLDAGSGTIGDVTMSDGNINTDGVINAGGGTIGDVTMSDGNINTDGVINAGGGTIGDVTMSEGKVTTGQTTVSNDGVSIADSTIINDHDVVINSGTENEVSLSDVGNRVGNLEQGVAELNNRVGELEDRIDKVGAMAAAIANLRTMGYDPAAPTEVAVGLGQYRDETGAALGLFHYPNRDFMLSLSVSTSGDEVMGGIGATWKFGRKSPEKVAEIKKAQAEADARRAEEAKLAKAEEMKQAAKEAKIKAQQERHAKLAAERAVQAEAAK